MKFADDSQVFEKTKRYIYRLRNNTNIFIELFNDGKFILTLTSIKVIHLWVPYQ